ncbi:hypothetical protein [Polaribacter sp.]|uniref:hypothetical protein n=1 Tax=Polaribacter sp. TaxID=1920175 RepID=UPI003F6BBF38
MKNLHFFLAIFFITLYSSAQEVAMINPIKFNTYTKVDSSEDEIIPLLEEAKYTYKYKGNNVLVIFSENEHIEYFEDKKYFIKSTVEWTSEDECFMTLKESTLPNFPFKSGTKLYFKINKIKRGFIFYESTLGGVSWEGKMKKI